MSTNPPRRSNFHSRSHSFTSQAIDEFTIENYKRKIKEQESEISDLQKELHEHRMKEGDFMFSTEMMKFSTEKKRKRDEYDANSCNDTSQSVAKVSEVQQQQPITLEDHPVVANGKPQIEQEMAAKYSAQVQNLEKENSDLKNNILKLKESSEQLEQEFKQFKETSKENSDSILSENKRITELCSQHEQTVNRLKVELEDERTIFSELDKRFDPEREELEEKVKTMEQLNSKLSQDIETLKKEKAFVEQQIISLNHDLINSQEQEKERAMKITELESSLTLLDDDKKRLENLVKENEVLSEERVRAALSESEGKDIRIIELEKQQEDLTNSVSELKAKIDEMINQSNNDQQLLIEIDNQKQLISQKVQELEGKNLKITELDTTAKKLQQDFTNEVESNSKTINELTLRIESLTSDLSSAQENQATLLNEKLSLQNDIECSENEKHQLTSNIQQLKNTNEKLQTSLSEHESQNQKLQSSLSEYESKCTTSVEQINSLTLQIEELKQVETQMQSWKSENEQLQNQLSSISEVVKTREGEISHQKEQQQQLVEQKDEEIRKIESNYQEVIVGKDTKLNGLESEIQELKNALELSTSEKNNLNTLIEQQQQTFETKINQYEEQEKLTQEKYAQATNEKIAALVEKYKTEQESLANELNQWKEKAQFLQTSFERYQEESIKTKKGIKRDSQDDTSSSSALSIMDPPKKKVKKELKVIFSGFNDKMEKYTNAFKKSLEDHVKELGGVIIEDVEQGATHVIAPPGVRTIKVLQAAVKHIWIMSPEWLVECKNQSRIVDEQSFGKKIEKELFRDKKIGFTEGFTKECDHQKYKAQKRRSNASTLVNGGDGQTVEDLDSADMILVAAEESLTSAGKTKRVYTWEGFLDYIFPKH